MINWDKLLPDLSKEEWGFKEVIWLVGMVILPGSSLIGLLIVYLLTRKNDKPE